MEQSARAEYFRQYKTRRRELAWPKCNDCGFIARKLPDVGCLECYARTFGRREWTRLEEDMIEIYAGKDDPAHLQLRIYNETRVARSRESIRQQIKVMGIKVTNHQDAYTIAQLVAITGRPYMTIKSLIDEGVIKNIGRGRRILISMEDGQRVIDRYTVSDRPSYSMPEAAAMLGYTRSTLFKALNKGLPSWKEGHRRRVCKRAVDHAVQYLRDTGNVRIHWRLLNDRG